MSFPWTLPPAPSAEVAALSAALGLHPVAARLMARRGFVAPGPARAFLEGTPPGPFAGIEAAAGRLSQAASRGERVLVFGDYDVDGICSAAIMVGALQRAGVDVHFRLPKRLSEGYGLSAAALEQAKEAGVDLVVTVDSGIGAVKEARQATALGLSLVITDHHEPGAELPEAIVANPHLVGAPPLSGAGIALLVAEAAFGPYEPGWPLAAVAVVADQVPLVAENRFIFRRGLEVMRDLRPPGLGALAAVAGCDPRTLTDEDIAFQLAPRLNALGRMGDATPGVRLFLTEDEKEARALAAACNQKNEERKRLLEVMVDEALGVVESGEGPVAVAREGWHRGLIGIVAARLAETTGRPSFVLAKEGDEAHGSARAPEGFDVMDSLREVSGLLDAFGGHSRAAGFSLKASAAEGLLAMLRAQPFEPHEGVQEIDDVIFGPSVDERLIRALDELRPFGPGWPQPRLALAGGSVRSVRTFGRMKAHSAFEIGSVPVVAWRTSPPGAGRAAVIGTAQWDSYAGRARLVAQSLHPLEERFLPDAFFLPWPPALAPLGRAEHVGAQGLLPAQWLDHVSGRCGIFAATPEAALALIDEIGSGRPSWRTLSAEMAEEATSAGLPLVGPSFPDGAGLDTLVVADWPLDLPDLAGALSLGPKRVVWVLTPPAAAEVAPQREALLAFWHAIKGGRGTDEGRFSRGFQVRARAIFAELGLLVDGELKRGRFSLEDSATYRRLWARSRAYAKVKEMQGAPWGQLYEMLIRLGEEGRAWT